MQNPEEFIKKGLVELGLLSRPEAPCRISYASRSLFPLYRIRLEGDGSPLLAAKLMRDPAMARSEAAGLRALREAGCSVPSSPGIYTGGEAAVLYMEFIEEGARMNSSSLVRNLLRLYSATGNRWGWEEDNFIGTLPQKNSLHDSFASYFWEDRLEAQLSRATQRGLLNEDHVRRVEELFRRKVEEWGLESHPPRLIHGDLWSGNLLPSRQGEVYLIDPSVALGHPEQDLAMLDLFGSPLSSAQTEEISRTLGMAEGVGERIPFWQIYPLLVHINIFGSSYVSSLERTLRFYR